MEAVLVVFALGFLAGLIVAVIGIFADEGERVRRAEIRIEDLYRKVRDAINEL